MNELKTYAGLQPLEGQRAFLTAHLPQSHNFVLLAVETAGCPWFFCLVLLISDSHFGYTSLNSSLVLSLPVLDGI